MTDAKRGEAQDIKPKIERGIGRCSPYECDADLCGDGDGICLPWLRQQLYELAQLRERESQRKSFAYGNTKLHNDDISRETIDNADAQLTELAEPREFKRRVEEAIRLSYLKNAAGDLEEYWNDGIEFIARNLGISLDAEGEE